MPVYPLLLYCSRGSYKAKTAPNLFLISKKIYFQGRSVIICSLGRIVLFASPKVTTMCVFPGKIMTVPSQSSLKSCRWEVFTCVSCKMENYVSSD